MRFLVRAAFASTLLIAYGSTVVGCSPAATPPATAQQAPAARASIHAANTLKPATAAASEPSPVVMNVAAAEPVPRIVSLRPTSPESGRTSIVRQPYQPPAMSPRFTVLHDDDPPVSRLPEIENATPISAHWGNQPAPPHQPTQYTPGPAPQFAQPSPMQSPALPEPQYTAAVPNMPQPQMQPQPPMQPAVQPQAPAIPLATAAAPQARPLRPVDMAALAPVSQQAELRVEEAFRMARRGALYAARAELIQSLRTIAQAVDTLEQDQRRSQALATGFQAMKEADDFFVRSDTLEHDLDVEGIVLAHRTPVLKGRSLQGVTSLVALQQYYSFAQQQFAIAAAGTPAGSRALYGLGKVHMTLARESGDDRSHQAPKAMAFFQAAMQADSRNYLAANELGVLLAQFGQLAEAKQALLHSVSTHSHAEGWQNLAVVHARLGEHELARLANEERQLLVARSGGRAGSNSPVEWVGPREFNAVGGPDPMAGTPQPATARSQQPAGSRSASSQSPTRR